MCGIAGFCGPSAYGPDAERQLRTMCDAIRHRGPDDEGIFVGQGVALGMRRLSIIDVAGGKQPITNEDGTVTVVFNGEIYNHRELRRMLEARGHTFSTNSDTEVLVHLYEERGEEMFRMLNGMFACAIWDSNQKRLLLGRDRAGIKPLNYREVPGGILFFSENRSLLALADSPVSIRPESVTQYLSFGYVPDPASIFEDVYKLPPAHHLTWTRAAGLRVSRYWYPPAPVPGERNREHLSDELAERLSQAVRRHLESEVPLGAFLSGGLDSTTVVSLMTRHATERVRTFSIGFEEQEFDESSVARDTAKFLGTEHTELILRPDVEETLDAIAAIFDEPFGDSSAIPTFFVSQLARRSVTVALSGDGGDELFGGYTRYAQVLGQREVSPLISPALRALARTLPHFAPGKFRLLDLARSRWGRYASQIAAPVRIDEGGVAAANLPGSDVTVEQQLISRMRSDTGEDFAADMMRFDLENYLPGDILTKVDRTSMAVSLEARVPFLDTELMDFALALPGEVHVDQHLGKRLLRTAIRNIVPKEILDRPKQGFAIPLSRWFRGPLSHRIAGLKSPSPRLRDFVDHDAVSRLVTEHQLGRRDHSMMLWRLLVLDGWMSAWNEGQLSASPRAPSLDLVES